MVCRLAYMRPVRVGFSSQVIETKRVRRLVERRLEIYGTCKHEFVRQVGRGVFGPRLQVIGRR